MGMSVSSEENFHKINIMSMNRGEVAEIIDAHFTLSLLEDNTYMLIHVQVSPT